MSLGKFDLKMFRLHYKS